MQEVQDIHLRNISKESLTALGTIIASNVESAVETTSSWSRYTNAVSLVTDQTFTNTFAVAGDEIDCRGYKTIGFFVDVTAGTSTDMGLKVLSYFESGGAEHFVMETSADYIKTIGDSSTTIFYSFNVEAIPYIRVWVKDDAGGDGTITINIIKEY